MAAIPLFELLLNEGSGDPVDTGSANPGAVTLPAGATWGSDGDGTYVQINGQGFFWPDNVLFTPYLKNGAFVARFAHGTTTTINHNLGFTSGATGMQLQFNNGDITDRMVLQTRADGGLHNTQSKFDSTVAVANQGAKTMIARWGGSQRRSAFWVDDPSGDFIQQQYTTTASLGEIDASYTPLSNGMRTGSMQNGAAEENIYTGRFYSIAYFDDMATTKDLMDYAGSVRPTDELNPGGVWTWFSKPQCITNGTKTWITSIAPSSQIEVTQVHNATGIVDHVTVVHPGFQCDDHNQGAMCIRGDGRLLIIYCPHSDYQEIYSRVSTNPGDSSSWQAEQLFVPSSDSTYTHLYRMTGTGRIYHFWRNGPSSASANWYYRYSNDDGVNWSGGAALGTTGSDGMYLRSGTNEIDRIYLASNVSVSADGQVDLYYAVLKDTAGGPELWNSDETEQLTLGASISTWEKIVDSQAGGFNSWVWDCEQDTVVWLKYVKGASEDINHEYWFTRRTAGTTWISNKIVDSGGSLTIQSPTPYSPGLCLNRSNPNEVFYITNAGSETGPYNLWKATTSDNGVTFPSPTNLIVDSAAQLFRPVYQGTPAYPNTGVIEVICLRGDLSSHGYRYFIAGSGSEHFGWGANVVLVGTGGALQEGISIERSDDGVSGWTEIDQVALGVEIYNDPQPQGTTKWYRVREFNTNTGSTSDYSNIDSAAAT